MSDQEVKQFNPYSFFYVHAVDNGDVPLQNNNKDLDCSNKNLHTLNSEQVKECLLDAYYKNKLEAISYVDTNTRDDTSKQKYNDVKLDYNEELINTINLSLGCLILTGFIVKNVYYP